MITILESSNNSYIVGGYIRDTCRNVDSRDLDFVTDISYDELVLKFKSNGFKVKETGKKFLVVRVKKGLFEYKISNFRKDGTYTDNRRPNSVDIGTIEEDAERRDFSINSIYFNLKFKI